MDPCFDRHFVFFFPCLVIEIDVLVVLFLCYGVDEHVVGIEKGAGSSAGLPRRPRPGGLSSASILSSLQARQAFESESKGNGSHQSGGAAVSEDEHGPFLQQPLKVAQQLRDFLLDRGGVSVPFEDIQAHFRPLIGEEPKDVILFKQLLGQTAKQKNGRYTLRDEYV